MWGIEGLWPELILLSGGLVARWRPLILGVLLGYALGVASQVERVSLLYLTEGLSVQGVGLFAGATLLAWVATPLRGGGAWAVLLQLAAYGLLLRSRHLAFSWTLMETAALAGYFLVISSCTEGQHKWSAALRYFLWSVTGSALILFAIAIRLVEGTNLTYPLTTGSPLADTLLAWGWSIKVGFLPWHFWLLGVYRALPVAWAAWFSVVPKGALLLNFLALLPPEGEALQGELFYLLATVSLVGAYAAAWAASTEIERLFWGSFAQAGYIALCAAPGAQAAGWDFWFVYGVASLLSFLYVEHPWTGRWGNAVGLLLLANLAALPPVLGFWVKVGLFWEGFRHLNEPFRSLLIGAAALATIGGFAVYGKLLWRLWQRSPSTPPWPRRLLYGAGALLLLGLGIGGLRWL